MKDLRLSELLSLTVLPLPELPGHYNVIGPRQQYRVRLNSEDGLVNCECPDWLWHVEPRLNKGAALFQRETLCKHVSAVLWYRGQKSIEKRSNL